MKRNAEPTSNTITALLSIAGQRILRDAAGPLDTRSVTLSLGLVL
ncbi:hypothetical protein [Shewanella benthica]|nr:hypothetical protein [Shewanella benthica]